MVQSVPLDGDVVLDWVVEDEPSVLEGCCVPVGLPEVLEPEDVVVDSSVVSPWIVLGVVAAVVPAVVPESVTGGVKSVDGELPGGPLSISLLSVEQEATWLM